MRIGKDETWKKIYASLFRDASYDPIMDGVTVPDLAAEMGVDEETAEEIAHKHCDAGVDYCKQCGYEHPIGSHDHDIEGDTGLQGPGPEQYQSMPSSEGNGIYGSNNYDDVLEAAVLAQIAKGIDPMTARDNAEEILAQDPRWSFAEEIIPKAVPKSRKPGQPSPPPPGKTENPRYELQNKPSKANGPSVPGKPYCDACDNIVEECVCRPRMRIMTREELVEAAKPAKPRRDEGEKPPVDDKCHDCGADVAACGCKNMAVADEQLSGPEMGGILEELAQSAYNKKLDELTYDELFKLQQALREMAHPKVHDIA